MNLNNNANRNADEGIFSGVINLFVSKNPPQADGNAAMMPWNAASGVMKNISGIHWGH